MERKGVQCIDIKVPDKNVEDKLRDAGFDIQEKGNDFCVVNDPDFATILLHYWEKDYKMLEYKNHVHDVQIFSNNFRAR